MGQDEVRIALEEAIGPTEFDASTLKSFRLNPTNERLLRQFNQAHSAESMVDKYLGFFKVLELAYVRSGSNFRRDLSKSDELFEIVRANVTKDGKEIDRNQFGQFVRELVRLRHNCVHLREGSGYAPGDPQLRSELEPLIGIIRNMSKETIERRLKGLDSGAPQ